MKAILVISVILCIAAFGCMIAAFVVAGNPRYDGYADGFYYDYIEYGNIEGISLSGCDLVGEIKIPSEIDGKPVLTTGSSWWGDEPVSFFANPEEVLSVTLPDTLQEIGDGMFKDCMRLEQATIPNRVTQIGRFAFSGCTRLKRIVIPENVKYIGNGAFEDCSSLTIYAEVASKPSGWSELEYGYPSWNGDCPVVWGYKG